MTGAPPQGGAAQAVSWAEWLPHRRFARQAAVWPGEAGLGWCSCTACSSSHPQQALPCCPLLKAVLPGPPALGLAASGAVSLWLPPFTPTGSSS